MFLQLPSLCQASTAVLQGYLPSLKQNLVIIVHNSDSEREEHLFMFVSCPGQYYPGTGVEGTWLVAEVGATAGAVS